MLVHLYTYINPVKQKDIDAICAVLQDDGVIAIALDVSWSFVCDASSSKALDKIRRLKPEHPRSRPFSLICPSISMASTIVNIDNSIYRILKKILPGPYTLLLERHVSLPKIIHDKRKEVGLRIPDSELVLAIANALGKPLAASTVPSSTENGPLPGFGWEVAEQFGHGLNMVVDLGEESPKMQTTIVDLVSGVPELVRQGAGDFSVFGKV